MYAYCPNRVNSPGGNLSFHDLPGIEDRHHCGWSLGSSVGPSGRPARECLVRTKPRRLLPWVADTRVQEEQNRAVQWLVMFLFLRGISLTGAHRGPPTTGRMDVVTVFVNGNAVLYMVQAGRALKIRTGTGEVGHACMDCSVIAIV